LPIESLIKEKQAAYYEALSLADKSGQSTPFITFILGIIHEALAEQLTLNQKPLSAADRLRVFQRGFTGEHFSRADYMKRFTAISAATASRDLKEGVTLGLLGKTGGQRTTRYHFL